jgi:hypothetical protein
MSNYSLIELQFSDIEMIDFLQTTVVVRKEERRFADEHSIKDNIESQVKMPEPTSRSVCFVCQQHRDSLR